MENDIFFWEKQKFYFFFIFLGIPKKKKQRWVTTKCLQINNLLSYIEVSTEIIGPGVDRIVIFINFVSFFENQEHNIHAQALLLQVRLDFFVM
jgi:hypothetical protein